MTDILLDYMDITWAGHSPSINIKQVKINEMIVKTVVSYDETSVILKGVYNSFILCEGPLYWTSDEIVQGSWGLSDVRTENYTWER